MEGCIQAIGDDVDKTYTIAMMSAYSTLPSVVVEDDDCVKPPLVSHSSIPIAHLTDRVTHSSRLLSFSLCLLTYVYKHIQKFDTVHVIAGPFANTIGTIVHIYHGIGWYTIKTSTCHLRIYCTDIELDDRLCVDDYVWVITADGLFLGRSGDMPRARLRSLNTCER